MSLRLVVSMVNAQTRGHTNRQLLAVYCVRLVHWSWAQTAASSCFLTADTQQQRTVGLTSETWPSRLLMMYCRSSFEMNRCSAGVLLVRSVHSTIVTTVDIPTCNRFSETSVLLQFNAKVHCNDLLLKFKFIKPQKASRLLQVGNNIQYSCSESAEKKTVKCNHRALTDNIEDGIPSSAKTIFTQKSGYWQCHDISNLGACNETLS